MVYHFVRSRVSALYVPVIRIPLFSSLVKILLIVLSPKNGKLDFQLDRPHFCYALWSDARGQFYIGVTDEVSRRCDQHNTGISQWTRGKGPWRVVWCQKFANLSEARQFERRLKRQRGGAGFFTLTGLDRDCFSRAR